MRNFPLTRLIIFAWLLCGALAARAIVIFSTYSPYHYIEVVDEGGTRTLSFNGSRETRMNRDNPLQGHVEYKEYFHMP